MLHQDFFSLFFPNLCAACGNTLWRHESVICTKCDFHLPRTDFHLDPENALVNTFTGRINPENIMALLYFNKGSHVQRMIHQLKYKGRKDIGYWFGRETGNELLRTPGFSTVERIIPVPLHPDKLLRRGYNQSEEFAKGISDKLNIPVDPYSLIRAKATDTQTRKSRFTRWENVSGIFLLADPGELRGKHILLVDDVITTGATLEACYNEIARVENVRISIAAIATALR